MDENWKITAPLVALTLLAVLFAMERAVPLRRTRAALFGRLLVNALMSLATFAVAAAVVRPAAMAALKWSSEKPFGIIHFVKLPVALQFALGFLLLDLAFYYWHVINHRVGFLWRFHNVHHADPDLDVSTGFRFHFGEVFFSTAFRVVQVALIGVTPVMFAAYEVVFQAGTLFHHSNVRLPIRLERLLNLVFVTPRMHGIHHSQVQRETNSNYSVVFSWWDRLHGTIGLNIPQAQITIGVPGYSRTQDNRLGNVLALPFRKQRDYWRTPDGSLVQREQDFAKRDRHRLAE